MRQSVPPAAVLADRVVLFLELLVHTFLYTQSVYPKDTFRRKRKLGTFVWVSRSRNVKTYVRQMVVTLQEAIQKQRVAVFGIELLSSWTPPDVPLPPPPTVVLPRQPVPPPGDSLPSESGDSSHASVFRTQALQISQEDASFTPFTVVGALLLQFDEVAWSTKHVAETLLRCTHREKSTDPDTDNAPLSAVQYDQHDIDNCFLAETSVLVESFHAALAAVESSAHALHLSHLHGPSTGLTFRSVIQLREPPLPATRYPHFNQPTNLPCSVAQADRLTESRLGVHWSEQATCSTALPSSSLPPDNRSAAALASPCQHVLHTVRAGASKLPLLHVSLVVPRTRSRRKATDPPTT